MLKKILLAMLTVVIVLGANSCGKKPTLRKAHIAEFVVLEKSEYASVNIKPRPKVIVYLPDNYDSVTNRYPVLYMHDGQNLENWKIRENINSLIDKNLMEPIIVVGIFHRGIKRALDYTPTKISNKWVNNEGGGLDKYSSFLTKELKPVIDKKYRTLPDRENTAIIGSSLAGIASFYLIGQNSDVFSKAGVISPSFWWDDVRVVGDMDKMKFPKDVKIYIDGGWREGADEASMIFYMRRVNKKLKSIGLKDFENIFYYEDPRGTHDEMTWARRGKMPLLFMFGRFDSEIIDRKANVYPPILEVGDKATISLDFQLKNNMQFTAFGKEFFLDNPDIATIDKDGTIIAKSVNDANLAIMYGGQSTSMQFSVYPKTDDNVYLVFKVRSTKEVDSISLVNTETGKKTTMEKNRNGVWQATIATTKNKKIKFSVENNDGKQGYSKKGNLVKRGSKCKENKVIELNIAEWK